MAETAHVTAKDTDELFDKLKDVKLDDSKGRVGEITISATATGKAPKCAVCRLFVTADGIKAMDQTFHVKCFKCTRCQNGIESDEFAVREGKQVCMPCINKEKIEKTKKAIENAKAAGEGDTFDKAMKTLSSGGDEEEEDDKEEALKPKQEKEKATDAAKGKEKCKGCGEMITGTAVKAKEDYYHEGCFSCSKCNQLFGDGGYVEHEGKPYHSNCYMVLIGAICNFCGKPLIGTYVKAEDKKFHKECLKCAGCGDVLQSGYIPRDGQLYCVACGSKPTATPTAANAAAAANTDPTAVAAAAAAGGDGTASQKKKFCINCGATLPTSNAKFCGDCGEKQA